MRLNAALVGAGDDQVVQYLPMSVVGGYLAFIGECKTRQG